MSWVKLGQDVDGIIDGGRFGQAVSISADGTTMVVGIPDDNAGGTASGQVRVFKYKNSTWVQHGDSINGSASGIEFGSSVSISNDGSVVAIGTPYGSTNNSGQVRVYKFITDTWVQQGANINGEIANENFGISVSLSSDGTTVVIGGTNTAIISNNTRGIVRIYKFINGSWVQQGLTINGEGLFDRIGSSVSISNDGSVVAIGAPFASGSLSNRGYVRIYKFINDEWGQQGTDIYGEAIGDKSGQVSLSGDGTTIAIGAGSNREVGTNSGHVRIYKFINGTWIQQGADIDGEATGDQSGFSVSISNDGSVVAIGAALNDVDGTAANAGHVRIYKFINGTWTQQGLDIDGEAAGDLAGQVSLSKDGTTVAIGASNNNGNGHVRVYKFITSTWVQKGMYISGEAAFDEAGYSVSLSTDGTTVAIGAPGNGANTGNVRIYKSINGTWIQQGTEINGENSGDRSGESVSLSADGTIVAIGSPYIMNGSSAVGYVRIYKFISGNWTQQGLAIYGESTLEYANYSGSSVSLSADGTTVAIGAPMNSDIGHVIGHVRVYKLINGTWIQQGADLDGASPYMYFGWSVSLSTNGSTVAVGTFDTIGDRGRVCVYTLIGGTWVQQGADIVGTVETPIHGFSVSLSSIGNTVAIGMPYHNVNGSPYGKVQVYKLLNNIWVKKGEDIIGETLYGGAGYSVSLSADGNTVAASSRWYTYSSGAPVGGTRIYKFIDNAWAKLEFDINGILQDGQDGHRVALSADGSTVAIGGQRTTTVNGEQSGNVRVFTYTKYFTPVSNETVIIERNASTSTNNISVSIGYDSSIQGEDINTEIASIECTLQCLTTGATAWSTLSSYTLTRNTGGDWTTTANFSHPFGGKARIVYTIVPVANSLYIATTFMTQPFVFVPFECDVAIFGVNTIKITPTNPVTGKVYAHKLSAFNNNAQPVSLTSSVPGFAYDVATSTGVVPAAYSSNPYSIGGISFTASNQYNIQMTTQVTGRDIKYRYITSLIVPSTIQSITTLSHVTGLSLNTITSLAANDPTLVPSLSGITNGLLSSALSANNPQLTGSAKTSVDESLKLVARAQAAASPTASITAMTIPYANLRYINSAGLFNRTAIVVAAVPPSNGGAARNCVLTPDQELIIRGGLFYIAGETGESLRLISQDGARSILFEFPDTGQVTIDGTPRSIGTTVVTAMGSLILNFSGSAGGSGVDAICFLADAPVLTPTGYRPIHILQVGDLVCTAAGRHVAVKRVFAKEYEPSTAATPFVIPKGMFGALRALPISPNHEVMVAGRGMVKAKNLRLSRMKMTGPFTYYNLELEDWVRDNLVVAGVECESLAPAKRITMTKTEFVAFVKARYGPASAARLRLQSVCFEESDGCVSLPKLQ